MTDNPTQESPALDSEQLMEALVNHSLYKIDISSPQKVEQTPEFSIISLLMNNPGIGIDDLVQQLDVRGMIIHFINRLREAAILTQEDDAVFVDQKFFQSLQPQTPSKPSPVPKKGGGSISEEQLEDIDRAIMGSRSRRDKLLSELSDAPTKEKEPDDELESLFDDVLGESLETVLDDFEEIQGEDKDAPIIPLVELLKQHGYTTNENYGDFSAYQILHTILQEHPISTEHIEKKVSSDTPLSLSLSNLKADELISQTNDYRWTLSKKVLQALKEYISSTKAQAQPTDPDLELIRTHLKNDVPSFVRALQELSYIPKKETTLSVKMNVPEVEVLHVIREFPDKTTEEIKHLVDNTLPVVVTRMLSRLQADGVVTRSSTGTWHITPRLHFLMAKEQLKQHLPQNKFEELEAKFGV